MITNAEKQLLIDATVSHEVVATVSWYLPYTGQC